MFRLCVLAVLGLGLLSGPALAQPPFEPAPGRCYTVCGPNGCYQVCPGVMQFRGEYADPYDSPYQDVRFRRGFREPRFAAPRGYFGGYAGDYGPYTPGRCPGGCPDCPRVRVNPFYR